MAARTHRYTQAASTRRPSNVRGTLAVLVGLAAAVVVPVAIELTRTVSGADMLDAAWAIPIAALAAVVSLILARGGRGERLFLAARVLAVTGICFTLSASLAVGIYEFIVRYLEH